MIFWNHWYSPCSLELQFIGLLTNCVLSQSSGRCSNVLFLNGFSTVKTMFCGSVDEFALPKEQSPLANRPRSTCFLYISVKALWVSKHQQNHGTSFLQLKNTFLETHTNIVLSSGKSHSWSAERRVVALNSKGNTDNFRKPDVKKVSFIEAKCEHDSDIVSIWSACQLYKHYFFCPSF